MHTTYSPSSSIIWNLTERTLASRVYVSWQLSFIAALKHFDLTHTLLRARSTCPCRIALSRRAGTLGCAICLEFGARSKISPWCGAHSASSHSLPPAGASEAGKRKATRTSSCHTTSFARPAVGDPKIQNRTERSPKRLMNAAHMHV